MPIDSRNTKEPEIMKSQTQFEKNYRSSLESLRKMVKKKLRRIKMMNRNTSGSETWQNKPTETGEIPIVAKQVRAEANDRSKMLRSQNMAKWMKINEKRHKKLKLLLKK